MKILIMGGFGRLGGALTRVLSKFYMVYPTDLKSVDKAIKLDITNKEEVNDVINKLKPDVIIHCAALTNVDYCEDHEEEAELINVKGTENLVSNAPKNTKFIYISSDYIFDGKNGPYSENDIPIPLSVYGRTKLEGEKNVIDNSKNFLILRTTVPYSMDNGNFASWLITELKKGNRLKIVDDQYGTPTYIPDFCLAIKSLIDNDVKNEIVNVVGNEWLNRFDFSCKIAEIFGLDPSLIEKASTNELKQLAPRPLKCGLNNNKLKRWFNFKSMKSALEEMKNETRGI